MKIHTMRDNLRKTDCLRTQAKENGRERESVQTGSEGFTETILTV